MFTGIIETIGIVRSIRKEEENIRLTIEADFASELKVDQSVAHNGVCLTVVEIVNNTYGVVAIQETLDKSNLGELSVGDPVNLERGMRLGDRLDGHIVQGHVDQTGKCVSVEEQDGSWVFSFEYDPSQSNVTIEKGSITINGVSLTVVDSIKGGFSVAIIPYTYEHTTFQNLTKGDTVNLEFDVIGKYVQRIMKA